MTHLLSLSTLLLGSANAAASSLPSDERSSTFVAGAAQLSELFGHWEAILLGGLASAAIIGIFAFVIAGAVSTNRCQSSLEKIQARIDAAGDSNG